MDCACTSCGHRQDRDDVCASCGESSILDLQNAETVDFLRDVNLRQTLKRQTQARMLGVAGAMIVVFLLWITPGYWDLRGHLYPGLPVLLDQWLILGLIAFALNYGIERIWTVKKRFPYISDEPDFAFGEDEKA